VPTPVTNSEEKTTTVALLGDRVDSAGIVLTVTSVARVDALNETMQALPGQVFVTADVLIENATRDELPYNAAYFTVKDANGFEYNASLVQDQATS
jgi:hypothetical protein